MFFDKTFQHFRHEFDFSLFRLGSFNYRIKIFKHLAVVVVVSPRQTA